MPVGPVIQHLRGEPGAVVDRDVLREPAPGPRGGQDARHVPARESRGSQDRHALACLDIEHGQDPHRAPVGPGVVHEIHRPPLIRLGRRRQADAGHRTAMPPRLAPSQD